VVGISQIGLGDYGDQQRHFHQVRITRLLPRLLAETQAATALSRSIPLTPASIFFMKCSWPGTSILRPRGRWPAAGEAEIDGHCAGLFSKRSVDARQGFD
jgi:hypothetical protein